MLSQHMQLQGGIWQCQNYYTHWPDDPYSLRH